MSMGPAQGRRRACSGAVSVAFFANLFALPELVGRWTPVRRASRGRERTLPRSSQASSTNERSLIWTQEHTRLATTAAYLAVIYAAIMNCSISRMPALFVCHGGGVRSR